MSTRDNSVPRSDAWHSLTHTLHEREQHLLFLHEQRYLDPLAPSQRERLQAAGVLTESLLTFVEQALEPLLRDLPPGMYFPVPLMRASSGPELSREQVQTFSYSFLEVDERQRWFWRGKPIVGKVLTLFEQNLQYDPEVGRYLVEYHTEGRWDKCYLRVAHTPVRGVRFDGATAELELNTGPSLPLSWEHLWLDASERLFLTEATWRLILLADQPRYEILSHWDATQEALCWQGQRYPLNQVSHPQDLLVADSFF